MSSFRVGKWLLISAALGAAWSGCAEGAREHARDATLGPIRGEEDAGEEDAGEEDAGEEDGSQEPEDASEPPAKPEDAAAGDEPDSARDATTLPEAALPSDAAMADAAGPLDAGAVDAGTPDAGSDAGLKPPAPLPTGTRYGEWTYVTVPGALCRDGSPAGYYHRKGDDNLMIFLNGSGACTDSFFCRLIPRNVDESLSQQSLLAASSALITGPDQTRQTPPDSGILRRDSRNPVASWSMIFVPYCTGDVHAGSKPNGMVPGAPEAGVNQFVGYTNVGLFLNSFGPSFSDTKKVLLAGTGAGGFGALLNLDRVQRHFDPQGGQVSVISDSGMPFVDQHLEACLQKRWRELWNFEAVLPKDCSGCRNPDGGGLALGVGTYLFREKYKDRMMGGVIASSQDQIIKLFFSAGLNNCTVNPADEAPFQAIGLGAYPRDRFPAGIRDTVNTVVGAERIAYYILDSSYHMHLWRSRYYEENNLGQSIASWVADVIAGKPTHRGNL